MDKTWIRVRMGFSRQSNINDLVARWNSVRRLSCPLKAKRLIIFIVFSSSLVITKGNNKYDIEILYNIQ